MLSRVAGQTNPVGGVANGTSKNVGLGKFWQDLKISEAFFISLEVSFFHGLFLLFLSLETFHQVEETLIWYFQLLFYGMLSQSSLYLHI